MKYQLSFAAFVFYVKKRDYTIFHPKKNLLSFWFIDKGKTQIIEILTDRKNKDHCGYIIFNSREEIDNVFVGIRNQDDYSDFIDELIEKCNRNNTWNGEKTLSKCGVLKDERANINTIIDDGQIIKCQKVK